LLSRSFTSLAFILAAGVALSACGTPATAQNPAATVNGTEVSMSAYNKELRFELKQQQDKLGLNPCQAKGLGPVCAQVKKTALDTLIDAILVRDYAVSHHIVVPQSTINRQWAVIYRQDFHNQRPVLVAYAKRFGWTPADVKRKTAEQLQEDAVMVNLTRNMPLHAPAVRLSKIDVKSQSDVSAVKAALASGQSFAEIAAKLNRTSKSLCSQVGCGDEGWLPEAFVPPGDKAVLTARIGQVVGPFAGQQFYELIQVTGRNPHYALTAPQILRFRQQKLLSWLRQREKTANIQRNVSV
jgi:parvulin-like peptidyl-prolyl isomerase